jgi:hypothetical protein
MKIVLAYPWVDADGTEHDPDSTVEVPDRQAKVLIHDGLARPVDAGQFDPARHTIEQVQAHLATADDAERTRVLDAERAGKARQGLLTPTSTEAGSA